MLEAVVLGHGDGEAESASFEGAGGVGSFFFDVEAGVALAVEHRGPAFAEGDWGYVRQDAGVAPHAEARGRGCGAGCDVFTLRGFFKLVHVVADKERAGAEGAKCLGSFSRDVMVATRTFERGDDGHILDANGFWLQIDAEWPSGRDRCARRGHFVTGVPLWVALPLVARKFLPRSGGFGAELRCQVEPVRSALLEGEEEAGICCGEMLPREVSTFL
jgi:hypothetical protein